jgi:hypothetical protein
MSRTLPGKLTITSHQIPATNCRSFTIEVADEISSALVLRAEISGEEFANALATLAYRPCSVTYYGIDVIGMKREHKTEIVPELPEFKGKYGKNDQKQHASYAVAPFEVDGWKAYLPDFGNSHCAVNGGYKVNFSRHVSTSEPTA